ncbi:hypothetical protein JCM10213_008696 [Rhodosporidiobolus nylandii]
MPFTLLASGYSSDISTLSLDLSASPSLIKTSTVPAGTAPTWLTLSPTKVVYTGDEFSEPDGALSAFTVGKDGQLSPLSQAKSGTGPVHFVLSKSGRTLYSANYGSGSLTTVGIKEDGGFVEGSEKTVSYTGTGPNKERQEGPHPHGVFLDPTGDYLLVADLGTDMLRVYYVADDMFEERPAISLPPGNGPRHLVVSPPSNSSSKTLLYLVEEITSTLAIFEVIYPPSSDDTLSLAAIQTELSTLPPDASSFQGDWTAAELAFSADGKYLYVSNRAPLDPHPESDTLAIFEINAEGGVVTSQPPTFFALGGRGPRHFSLTPKKDGVPAGKYMAVALQRTNEVVVFEAEGKNLTEVARVKDVKEPTAVVWL